VRVAAAAKRPTGRSPDDVRDKEAVLSCRFRLARKLRGNVGVAIRKNKTVPHARLLFAGLRKFRRFRRLVPLSGRLGTVQKATTTGMVLYLSPLRVYPNRGVHQHGVQHGLMGLD
jgi:hypothetical protein